MRTIYFVSFIVAVTLISSCSSHVISFYVVDKQDIKFETFSFYDRDSKNLRPQQQGLDSLIELAITTELTKKGFIHQNYGDVFVNYQITLGTSSTDNFDTQNYYSRNYYNRNYYPYYNVSTTQYKEGVLLIELITGDDKLLWQGSKAFKVRRSVSTNIMLIEYAKEITNSFLPNL